MELLRKGEWMHARLRPKILLSFAMPIAAALAGEDGAPTINSVEIVEPASDAATAIRIGEESLQKPNLQSFERLAMGNHPALAEAQAGVEAARGLALQAGLYPNPVLEGGTNQLGGRQTQFLGVLNQEFVTKGKLRLNRAAVERQVEQAELRFQQTRFDVLTTVRQVFYRGLVEQERVGTLEKLVKLLDQSYEAAVRREKGGEAAKSDTLLLRAELQRASVRLRNSKTLLDAVRAELSTVVGVPDFVVSNLEGELRGKLPVVESQLVDAEMIVQNAELLQAQVEVARRQILLRRAQVEPCPNVTLQAGYQYSAADPNNQAIVQLSVPLPTWNRNQGSIRAARANVSQSVEGLRRTENELLRRVIVVIGQLRAAQELVDEYENQILPAAEETSDITRQAYEKGQFDLLKLLQAQRNLVESNLEYLDAQLARWDAATELTRLTQRSD